MERMEVNSNLYESSFYDEEDQEQYARGEDAAEEIKEIKEVDY